MPGNDLLEGDGEEVRTFVDHGSTSPYECLSWAAIIFSTTVMDTDSDEIPDKLEDVSGLKDPNGEALPDLWAMGASSTQKDLFVEIGAMTTPGYTGGQGVVSAHNHMPTPGVLRGWVTRSSRTGSSCTSMSDPTTTTWVACMNPSTPTPTLSRPAWRVAGSSSAKRRALTAYLERSASSRHIQGRWAGRPASSTIGMRLRSHTGQELSAAAVAECAARASGPALDGACRRRFDRARKDLFHYALCTPMRLVYPSPSGHVSIPRVDRPRPGVAAIVCRPTCRTATSTCREASSGTADFGGGDLLVTLGLWDYFVGSEFVQASTTMHELDTTSGSRMVERHHYSAESTAKSAVSRQPESYRSSPTASRIT